MTRIVLVHGIGQQLEADTTLKNLWSDALRGGVRNAGLGDLAVSEVACAFYGILFRLPGTMGDGLYDASDVEEGFEQELLAQWWQAAADTDSRVVGPGEKVMGTPILVQRALDALSGATFFAGIAEHLMIRSLKQVRRYFSEPELRLAIRRRVEACVTGETRVLVGHSLGSVAAYEALCANPQWNVRMFVSLGSPLGIRNLIFNRLLPPPRGGIGAWPGSAWRWVNVAAPGDVVALEKRLAKRFGDRVEDRVVHNETRAHDVEPYLTAVETADAIVAGLRD